MIKLKVLDIAAAVKGNIIHGCENTTVDKISLDTRTLEPGSLYIPIKGTRFDGHDFLEEAAKKGAKAMFLGKGREYRCKNITIIGVEDTLNALHLLAQWYRNKFKADFIAITGSTGKTTTKNMIAAVLEKRFEILKTPGNYNNEIGLPTTIMKLNGNHQLGVIETGMSGFGEIERLMKIVRPKVSVITNIGMSHIEKLNSREGILKAKMEVFKGMDRDPTAVINADDSLLKSGSRGLNIPVIYYGIKEGDYRAFNVLSRDGVGMSYDLLAEGDRFEVVLPLPGLHNVYNSLAAIAVGRYFGIGFKEIIEALKDLKGEKMRLTVHDTPEGIKVINDAYNASPESMKSALQVLYNMPGERKIAVLSDMLEMGEFAEEGHRMVGKFAIDAKLDVLITIGDKSRFIASEAKERGMEASFIYHFNGKREAMQLLNSTVKRGDVILIKGSRRMRMEELVDEILERS